MEDSWTAQFEPDSNMSQTDQRNMRLDLRKARAWVVFNKQKGQRARQSDGNVGPHNRRKPDTERYYETKGR